MDKWGFLSTVMTVDKLVLPVYHYPVHVQLPHLPSDIVVSLGLHYTCIIK